MKSPLRRPFARRFRPVPLSPLPLAASLLAAGFIGAALRPAARAQAPDTASETPVTAASSPDRIVVTASPLDRSAFDLAQPVSSLSGLDLKQKKTLALGDTLNGEPGVSASGFTGGASRPIIRGQADNRVRVLNNGTEVFDVSNLSPDHAPSVEPLISSSIEVVRGPATILYGSSAIGGVVNVLDGRIPTAVPANGRFAGELIGRLGSVDLERSGAFSLDLAVTPHLVLHADGTRSFTNDLKVPDHALSRALRRDLSPDAAARGNHFGGDTVGYAPNTYVQTKDFGFGASYVWDKGYVGAAFSQFLSIYGVPVDPGEVVNGPPPEVGSLDPAATAAPVPIRLDVTKRRGELRASLADPFPLFRTLNARVTYTDYKHNEIDGATEVGVTFKTNGVDSRLELVHQPFGRFEGSVGGQIFYKHLEVIGDDAFLQPTDTVQPAAFVFEEVRLIGGDAPKPPAVRDPKDTVGKGAIAGGTADAFQPSLRLQFGGRVEFNHISIDSTDPLLTSIPVGSHRDSRSFVPVSASGGLVYEFIRDTALALTLSYSERAPVAEELYARGVHDATFQYLVGDPNLGKEKQLGVDVSIRRRAGFVTGSLSGFYNRFYDFIDFNPTGEFIADQRVFNYAPKNADFYGGEGLLDFHLLPATISRPVAPPDRKGVKAIVTRESQGTAVNPNDLYLELRADYVHAEDRDSGESLPRITPLRVGAGLGFTNENFSAKVEGIRVNHQYRVAQFETATPGYTFLNASASYRFPLPLGRLGMSAPVTTEIFVRGTNLLNETGRNHQSFLKEVLPLPGRSVAGGVRLTF